MKILYVKYEDKSHYLVWLIIILVILLLLVTFFKELISQWLLEKYNIVLKW